MGFFFLASYVVYGIMIVFYVLFFFTLGTINVTVITLQVRMANRQKEKSVYSLSYNYTLFSFQFFRLLIEKPYLELMRYQIS